MKGRVRMKVIFLDIDGVLNCDRTPNPRHFPYIVDDRLLARFRELVDASGAHVVLTSSWRVDPIGLYAARFYEVPFDDIAPDMPGMPRRTEILEWLGVHAECSRYAVIDDEDDELDELPLFQPSARAGLSAKICKGVLDYLEGKTDVDMRAGFITRAAEKITSAFHRNKD